MRRNHEPVVEALGIKFGIAMPTEASSLAVVYGMVLSALIYRAMPLRTLLGIAEEMRVFGWHGAVCAILGVGFHLGADGGEPAAGAGDGARCDGRRAFLAGSVVLLIVIGSLLEGLPALIILAPLLLPIAVRMDVDAVQCGNRVGISVITD